MKQPYHLSPKETHLTIQGLLSFRQEAEVTYCSCSGTINKRLTIACNGNYKIYHNKELVLETLNPSDAIEAYENLKN